MAWTELCKLEFKQQADHFYYTQKGRKNLTKVLKKLSQESKIPYNTLRRWYYEEEEDKKKRLNGINNDTTPEPTEDTEKKEDSVGVVGTCSRCKQKPVEIMSRTGKPAGGESKYYGLCSWCRKKDKIMSDAIRTLQEKGGSGTWVRCPCGCEHDFLIPNKEG